MEHYNSPILDLPTDGWDWEVSQPEWMLDKLIPVKSVGMLFGPSNAGKSHLACDLIIDVLAGSPEWQGIGLQGGDVVMFSESHGHIKARLKAYRNHKGKHIQHRMHTLPTMGFETIDMADLCAWIYMLPEPPVLMVFDTLATAFSIEENDNKEASKLIKALEEYILPAMHPLGSIMLVHHTSKASEGRIARGASALIGNIDYSINCQWDDVLEKTVAKWEKDRWRLMKEEPQWSGIAKRVPVAFTNGDTEMMVLDWSPYSEEEQEAARRLQDDLKLDAMKQKVKQAIDSASKPVFIHTNSRARVPTGYVPLRLTEIVASKSVPAMIEYIKEIYECEPVFTPKGAEVGINVVAAKSPI
jgi:hypothetical protein